MSQAKLQMLIKDQIYFYIYMFPVCIPLILIISNRFLTLSHIHVLNFKLLTCSIYHKMLMIIIR